MKLNKKKAEEKIKEFFEEIRNKSAEEIKKIKKLAMSHNIKLRSLRKKFCKYCYSPKLKVKSIKNGIKRVECENGHLMRWRVKNKP